MNDPVFAARGGNAARQIAVLTASVLVALWATVAYWSFESYQQSMRERTNDLVQRVSIAEEQAAQTFSMLKIALVSANAWLARHPLDDPGENAEFIDLVNALRESSGRRVDVRMVTRQARLAYVPKRDDAAATDVSDREYYTAQLDAATRGLHIAPSVLSRVTKKWGIPVSIAANGNGPIAVLFGAIELDTFEKLQTPLLRDADAQILVVRNDGRVLSRVPFAAETIGRSLADLPLWRERIGVGGRGSFVAEETPFDARKQVVAFAHLTDYPLVVIAVAPLGGVLKAWRHGASLAVALALLLSAVILLMASRLSRAVTAGEEARRQLEASNRELNVLSVTDKLTQLYNRVRLDAALEHETSRAMRYGLDLSLVLIDIDRFKEINDRHGHRAGDAVLVAIAARLKRKVRETDTLGRWGGEEFLLILPQTSAGEACEVAEKIRRAIAAEPFAGVGRLTSSFGVSAYRSGESPADVLARADAALYEAKNAGRDRVVLRLCEAGGEAAGAGASDA